MPRTRFISFRVRAYGAHPTRWLNGCVEWATRLPTMVDSFNVLVGK
ncbi:hypothetical protein [Kingella sp. (in: b-proteobacteria)]|nr:hypothetical protein [Kingella sp. (in: b-proteobacteria)]